MVTTCISTTLVLMLLGIVVLFVTVGNNFSRQIREGLTVEVMVSDTIHRSDLLSLQTFLRQAPFSRRVDYISKERGTREMNEALQGNMGEFIGSSPIPAEFEVYLNSAYANLDSLSHFEPVLRSRPGVIEVAYPRDVMESLDRTIPMVGLVLLIAAALLALVSFALINNSVRMSVYARRFSIHTMKLVGAEWSFIRRPFLRRAFFIFGRCLDCRRFARRLALLSPIHGRRGRGLSQRSYHPRGVGGNVGNRGSLRFGADGLVCLSFREPSSPQRRE